VKLKVLLIIFLFTILSGCYTTYSGIYFLDRAQRPASVTFDDIAAQMTDVLEPFGFRKNKLPKELETRGIVFSHYVSDGDKELISLSGAGSHVSISINLQNLSITIRDYDNDKETDFTRAIKRAIEKRLQEYYKLRGLKFERQVDILA
jgi:hypothetical protein